MIVSSGKRISLRQMKMDDAQAVFNYRSDSETNRYQGWIPENIEEVNEFIENRIAKEINIPATWFQFVIIRKENDEVIGDIGVHFIEGKNDTVEIGCTIAKNYHGNGYAIEALDAIIDFLYGEFGKKKIIAEIEQGNDKAVRLIERLGFERISQTEEGLIIFDRVFFE